MASKREFRMTDFDISRGVGIDTNDLIRVDRPLSQIAPPIDLQPAKFLGTYANLTGCELGNFRVEGLAGRDPSGAPCWRIVCDQCRYPQTLPHAKLAPLVQGRHSQITLLCANSACPLSRNQHHSETIDEFRRRERTEAEQAASAAAEAERTADAKAAKDRAQAVRDAFIQREYLRYLNHQWMAGQDDAKICTRQRWFELTDGTRRTVLDLIEKDPTLRISRL